MKRFAAHYLFVPGSGFLKQYAIEIEGGYICHIFPFSEEIESVEWFPGVILLTPQEESDINTLFNFTNIEKQSIYMQEFLKTNNVLVENLYISEAGCVISSHCGSGTIGILYIVNE